jgi:hypothetical protein
MLVPAMAFAWCVLSAEAQETQNAARVATVAAANAQRAAAQLTPEPPTVSPTSEQRIPIRSAIPAEVISFAKTLVNLPMGAEQIVEIAEKRYVFVLERHYHPPGFVGAPVGWHKGVTAYELPY